MRASLFCVSVTALSVGASFDDAAAQRRAPSDLRDSVLDKLRRDYQPDGARAGAFVVSPVARASIAYKDNLFAVPPGFDANQPEELTEPKDAMVYTIGGGLQLQSDWPIHGVRAFADVTTERIPEFDTESATSYVVGGEGLLELGQSTDFRVRGQYSSDFEDRTTFFAPFTASSRTQFSGPDVDARLVRRAGSVEFIGGVAYTASDYDDSVDFDGTVVGQDFRDYDQLTFTTEIGANISNGAKFFVRGDYAQARFDVQPDPAVAISPDADQYSVLGGVSLDITNLIYGEAAIGFQVRDFVDPNTDNADFFSVDVDLEWYVQPQTTVFLDILRTAREAQAIGLAGAVATRAELGVQRKLRYNLAAVGRVAYRDANFDGFVITENRDIDRDDTDFVAGADLVYYLRNGVRATLSYEHIDRDSEGLDLGRAFVLNRVGLELQANF
ncbi:MAG: outer membrane beta-barrel protein [Pseudomonadota bacterium]